MWLGPMLDSDDLMEAPAPLLRLNGRLLSIVDIATFQRDCG